MKKLRLLKDERYIKIFTTVFVLVWCIVIFYLSHQNANVSGSSSLEIVKSISEQITNTELTKNDLDNINNIFRTFMHGFVYFVLSFLTLIASYFLKVKNMYIVAVSFTFIYSITDEIHQHFIPGRSCEINDILVDFIGNILAVVVFLMFSKILKVIRVKQKKYLK